MLSQRWHTCQQKCVWLEHPQDLKESHEHMLIVFISKN